MVTGRLKAAGQEWAARLLVVLLLTALLLAITIAAQQQDGTITLHATMPESGGWQPGTLSATVGEPLDLRLTSDDVVHGFAVGAGPDGKAHPGQAVEVEPGQVTELALTFDRPGTYTYFCTRWCGPNHWRMRGIIEVTGQEGQAFTPAPQTPLYVRLGLDIDTPHPAPASPAEAPLARRGAELTLAHRVLLGSADYMTRSPAEVWLDLRDRPDLASLDDGDLWDAVAFLWRQNTTAESLALGRRLYSQNCAACHGEGGAGDGVFARSGPAEAASAFTEPAMLGASNALLEGKILRGGMGTGMPAWGAIFSDEERQAILDYLWTFQFPEGRS